MPSTPSKRASLIIILLLAAVAIYFLPPIHTRLAWRLANLRTQIHYLINPPEQVVFLDSGNQRPTRQNQAQQITPAPTRPAHGATPTSTTAPAAPTAVQTPLPPQVILSGIVYEWQSFNNCGPANLAMLLSFWGWQGDQRDTKAVLRPNEDDANVMPAEMIAFVKQHTQLDAWMRLGGDLPLLKRLIAAGFPVLIETGHQPAGDWWMGHYVLLNGYDDAAGQLISQDSLIMENLPVAYADLEKTGWRDFNYLYIVAFPPEREGEIRAILGADADPQENLERTSQRAVSEAATLTGRDRFFALYNQGDCLLAQGDAPKAARAYDLAFQQYREIEKENRPWRTLWYRVGPYQAYYEAGRYQDVIDLANDLLSMLSKRGLEESHYWRGRAYETLGDRENAIFDYEIALRLRPTYPEAAEQLAKLKAALPTP